MNLSPDLRHIITLPDDIHGPMRSIYFHLIGGSQTYLIGLKPVFLAKNFGNPDHAIRKV